MNTYLLTWNPRSWEGEASKTAAGQVHTEEWSTGRRKDIRSGDRLFLLKQGIEPKGIMGSGTAVSGVEPGEHWDTDQSTDRGNRPVPKPTRTSVARKFSSHQGASH